VLGSIVGYCAVRVLADIVTGGLAEATFLSADVASALVAVGELVDEVSKYSEAAGAVEGALELSSAVQNALKDGVITAEEAAQLGEQGVDTTGTFRDIAKAFKEQAEQEGTCSNNRISYAQARSIAQRVARCRIALCAASNKGSKTLDTERTHVQACMYECEPEEEHRKVRS